jgi:ubiquinone biosynthesis protein
MRQVFEAGFFHADPHPGNFLVLADGRIALLDFGMVGRLDDEHRLALVRLLGATVRQDAGAMALTFQSLGILRSPASRQAVRCDLRRLLDEYYGLSMDQFTLSDYVTAC